MSGSSSSLQSSLVAARAAAAATSDTVAAVPTGGSLDAAAASVSESRRLLTASAAGGAGPERSDSVKSLGRGRGVGGRGRGGRGGRGRGRGGGGGRGRGRKSSRGFDGDGGLPPVCRFFKQNRCNAGSACRFRHTQEAAWEAAMTSSSLSYDGASDAAAARAAFLRRSSSSNRSLTASASLPRTASAASLASSNDDKVDKDDAAPPPLPLSSSSSSSFRRREREYDPHKATAIRIAKEAQDAEPTPWRTSLSGDDGGPFYGIDVECVATGYGHGKGPDNRTPARVALVDADGNVVVDEIVRLDSTKDGIVSYLTELTGLTQSLCERSTNGTLEDIVKAVRAALPKDAVIVGQSVKHDLDWLGLKEGTDYADSVDIAVMFRQRIPKNLDSAGNVLRREAEREARVILGQAAASASSSPPNDDVNAEKGEERVVAENVKGNPSEGPPVAGNGLDNNERSVDTDVPDDSDLPFPTRYRHFSLRHTALHLLDVDVQRSFHDPVIDARYALLLFLKHKDSSIRTLRSTRDALHRAPPTPSFSSIRPVIDGVCLGKNSYRYKRAARFVWKWWTGLGGGANGLKVRSNPSTPTRLQQVDRRRRGWGNESNEDVDVANAEEGALSPPPPLAVPQDRPSTFADRRV